MKTLTRLIVVLAVSLLIGQELTSATLRRLIQRQANEETGTTTEAGQPSSQSPNSKPVTSEKPPPTRLFPDPPSLGSSPFGPQTNPFGQVNSNGLTPFMPFLQQRPPLQMQSGQPMPPTQTRQQTPTGESFQRGLGKRLLALAGVDSNSSETEGASMKPESVYGALSNGTVLDQLNRGLLTVYAGLSKAYNETVQRQVNVLQEKFKKANENRTSPWTFSTIGDQMPDMFKSLAARAGEAQASLSKAWLRLAQANETTVEQVSARIQQEQQQQPRSFFDSINSFVGEQGGFFDTGGLDSGQAEAPRRDFATQMRDFWGSQVQPHIVRASGMISNVWQDMRLMMAHNPIGSAIDSRRARPLNETERANLERGSSELVDSILQGVSLDGPEYSLLEAKVNETGGAQEHSGKPSVGSRMQTQFVQMQRQLNDLWRVLSNRLQSAIMSTGKDRVGAFRNPFRSQEAKIEQADPEENEISGKLKELSAIQQDADQVFQAVQRQKLIQEQQQQQRHLFGDDFRNFFNNIDSSVNRMGAAIGDFWQRAPERWNSFTNRMRPTGDHHQQQKPSSTTPPTSSSTVESSP